MSLDPLVEAWRLSDDLDKVLADDLTRRDRGHRATKIYQKLNALAERPDFRDNPEAGRVALAVNRRICTQIYGLTWEASV